MNSTSKPRGHLSFRARLLFVLGYPGWAVTSAVVSSIGIYFYLPPEGAGLETQVSEEIFLGVLTAGHVKLPAWMRTRFQVGRFCNLEPQPVTSQDGKPRPAAERVAQDSSSSS